MKKINLNVVRIDGGTQPRERIDLTVVGEYAEAIKAGDEFEPIVVFHDGAEYWLADGFHRYHSHKQAGKASITADVRAGTLDDAKLYAGGANGKHGLRRTNEDKRRAVQMTLGVAVAAEWSDTKIAKHCGVSVPFVSAIRRPEVAEKQRENRSADADRIAADRNPITPLQSSQVFPKPATKPKRDIDARPATVPQASKDDALAEAQHTVQELAEENERLSDRLAVEAMDASEEEKTQAAETIRDLRARVKTLEAELAAVKASRDTYMRESREKELQISMWRKKAEKAERAAA